MLRSRYILWRLDRTRKPKLRKDVRCKEAIAMYRCKWGLECAKHPGVVIVPKSAVILINLHPRCENFSYPSNLATPKIQ